MIICSECGACTTLTDGRLVHALGCSIGHPSLSAAANTHTYTPFAVDLWGLLKNFYQLEERVRKLEQTK